MIIASRDKVPKLPVPGISGVTIQQMITQAEGAPNFFMRIFEMDPGVTTEPHSHDFEHEIYILEGEAYAVGEGDPKTIKAGDTLYIPSMEKHTFRNDGPDKLCWICLIPAKVGKG